MKVLRYFKLKKTTQKFQKTNFAPWVSSIEPIYSYQFWKKISASFDTENGIGQIERHKVFDRTDLSKRRIPTTFCTAVAGSTVTETSFLLQSFKRKGLFARSVQRRAMSHASAYVPTRHIADLVAIPDFGTGAEENWGLIGYSAAMVLFDPNKTSDSIKQDVCETVTHELAHQVSGESRVHFPERLLS